MDTVGSWFRKLLSCEISVVFHKKWRMTEKAKPKVPRAMVLKADKKLETFDWLDFAIAVDWLLLCALHISTFKTRMSTAACLY